MSPIGGLSDPHQACDAEIARLRAEVERLQSERDDLVRAYELRGDILEKAEAVVRAAEERVRIHGKGALTGHEREALAAYWERA